MDYLDFFGEFLARGRVLGVGVESSSEEWDGALGEDYVENRRKGMRWRDYGMVEATFGRSHKYWTCSAVSIQSHRALFT